MTTHTTIETKTDAKTAMDRMYRWTRHVYDLSRKYFLLGRDRLIEQLDARENERVCEVGCGTARNLIKMARAYPGARFYGLDASDEMLKTARISLNKKGFSILLSQGYAQDFSPEASFDLREPLDKIVFSYALSIIPPWQDSLDHALEILPEGGEIHIVDFGGMDGQPSWFRAMMFRFLGMFHVYHKPEILAYLTRLEGEGRGRLEVEHLYKGYCYRAVFRL